MLRMDKEREVHHVHMIESDICIVIRKVVEVVHDLLRQILPLAFNLVKTPDYHLAQIVFVLIFCRPCSDLLHSLFDHSHELVGVIQGFCDVVHDIENDGLCIFASKQEFDIVIASTCDGNDLIEVINHCMIPS